MGAGNLTPSGQAAGKALAARAEAFPPFPEFRSIRTRKALPEFQHRSQPPVEPGG